MLDEAEFAEVSALLHASVRQIKGMPLQRRRLPPAATTEELYKPGLDAFEQLTGYRETNPNAIMHRRIAMYGPPCASCGKPLRTPRARMCVACGAERQT